MGRPRKVISPSGNLRCSKCGRVKHISRFYVQQKMLNGEYWFKDKDGGEWDKPTSHCRDCFGAKRVKARLDDPDQLDREAMEEYTTALSDEAGLEVDEEAGFNAPDPLRQGYVPMGPPSPERKSEPESMSDEEVAELVAILNRPRNTM